MRRAKAHERRQPDEQRCADADGIRVREPRHAPAAREDDQDGSCRGEVGGVCVGAESRVLPSEPLGEPVRRREPPEQLLGVGQRRVRGGKQQQDSAQGQHDAGDAACPWWPGQLLAEAGQRRVEPQRLCAARYEQHVQERERRGNGEREERDDGAGAAERLDARRLVLVRAPGQRVAAAEERHRQREADQQRHGDVGDPPAGSAEARRGNPHEHVERDVVADERHCSPHHDAGEHAHPDPHAAGDQARRQIVSHAGAQPQHAEQHGGEHTRDFFGGEARRGRPAGNGGDDEVRDVMADEHAGERGEHEALDEDRRGRQRASHGGRRRAPRGR